MRIIMLIAGFVALSLGIIGIVTPILPTTPFLLLSAACFARSSPRFHTWLLEHPTLGPPIKDWQNRGAIRRKAKIVATICIFVSGAFPVVLVPQLPLFVRAVSLVSLSLVLIFIWTRPQ